MAEMKEWTLMFYFASDNPLAPGIVAQMKSLKNAGFHPKANVIAQFDPNTVGTPTHIFDVNHVNKLKSRDVPNIGFADNDPFVRSLVEDKLWRDQKTRDGKSSIRDGIKQLLRDQHEIDYNPPEPPPDRDVNSPSALGIFQELAPELSLRAFLKFCAEEYPARHYILFILGHGLVVGNDVFLFDEHAPEHSLSLKTLGQVLTDFKHDIKLQDDKAEFEMVGFHSCSVSSLEVAYELQGTANYMLASQGPAFVGSWPYRQILIRVFNDLEKEGANIDVKKMLVKIFYFCLYNSADFLLAGYSFDLCLCNLKKVSEIKEPLEELSKALIDGLADQSAKDFILLSHLKSQSYWQEMYTDLYDFCFCLSKRCEGYWDTEGGMPETLQAIHEACGRVLDQLVKETKDGDDRFIVRAEFAGPAYQYSHGLSVYFPWAQPSDDSNILREYERYKFHEELNPSWLTFLLEYFDQTMRDSHKSVSERDERHPVLSRSEEQRFRENLQEDIVSLIYNEEGPLSRENSLSVLKVNPIDGTGDDCVCGSIKNHPHDTRPRSERGKQADDKAFLISDNFFQQFE